MATLSNNTLANPGNSFYALAGESGKNWYQYPSLNGSVLLQDASGIQVLQAVGNDLFYNQELLAKAGDIQDIAAWSDYPVLNPGGVNFNGNPLVNASTISTTGDISSNGDIHSTALFVTAGIETGASGIFTNFLSTNGGVGVSGNVKTATVSATGLVSAGSVTASGAVQGGSLVTTGGLDMTNTAITRASSVGISNAGFAPYGSLTSPDGVQLTWNGAAITTGGAGNVSQWANFNAVNTINAASNNITNVGSITATSATVTDASMGTMSLGRNQITGSSATPMIIKGDDTQSTQIMGGSITETSTTGNISITSYNNVNVNSGNDITMLSDAGINPLVTPTIGMTAQNGNGGRIDITANAGYGINPVQIGYGVVNVKALGAANGLFNLGGKIDLTAYSGGLGDYGGFTSRVSASAATIALSAGAAPVLPGLAGSMNIFGQGAISIVCSLVPPVLPQFPQTIYMFANGIPGVAGGVRLESPNGIQMLSDTYINNLYPLDTGGLKIAGRSFLGTANVTIEDVASLTAVAGSGQVKTDLLNSVTGSGVLYLDNLVASTATKGIYANFLKPLGATAPGVPNLIISNNPFGGNNNYVDISGAGVISFDSTGSGKLLGVQSINNVSWPPATGDASLWSQYPQSSLLDGSGFGMINVGNMSGVVDINGQAYTSTSQWSTFNAVSSVDLSSNSMVNVASINVLDNATIVSAGSLGIFTDGKDLTLASDNSGNVNIGTGNQGNINITTSGAGNDLTLAGDTVNIDAALGVRIAAPYLDMTGNNINNVNQINGIGGTTELRIQNTGTGGTSILDLSGGILIASQYAPVTIDGGNRLNLQSTTGNITLDPLTGSGTVNMLGDTIIGTVPAPQTLTVNGTARATGDVISSFGGSTPYSLNTIGALVNGNQQYNYWVAVNGSDISGTGSVICPFASITAALAATVGITDTIPVNICLTAGTYTENPTMTRNNTFISGSVGIADCVIVGTFTFNSTSSSTVSQGLTGVTVVGNVICSETTSSDTTWYIQNCNITSYGTTAIAATSTGAGNNGLVLYNTVVTQNVVANPCISIATVRLNAIQSQLNNTTTGSAVSCSGTGSMSLFGITLTCA